MESVINVSIWFLPLREEMEERRNGALSFHKRDAASTQREGGRDNAFSAQIPKVDLMVYVIIILITARVSCSMMQHSSSGLRVRQHNNNFNISDVCVSKWPR